MQVQEDLEIVEDLDYARVGFYKCGIVDMWDCESKRWWKCGIVHEWDV